MNSPDEQPYQPSQGSQFVQYGANRQNDQPPAPITDPIMGSSAIPPAEPIPAPFIPPIPPKKPAVPARHRRHWPLAALIILIILCAGAYAAYAFVIVPDKALPKALATLSDPKKFHASLQVSAVSSDANISGASLSVAGDADWSSGSLRDQTSLEVKSPSFPLSAEVRYLDDVLYGRITNIPPAYTQYLSAITGKWYSLSMGAVKALAETYHATSSLSAKINAPADIYADLVSKGILSGQRFLGFGQEGGELVRRYAVSVDKDAIARAAVSSASASAKYAGQSLADMEQEARQELSRVEFAPLFISVGLGSGSLRSVSEDIAIASSTAGGYSFPGAVVSYRFSYGDFPAGLVITAPSGATSLDPLIQQALKPAPVLAPARKNSAK